MAEITPSLADIFKAAQDASLNDVRVALPAKVLAYDTAKQTVDVQPTVKQVVEDVNGNAVELSFPRLNNIPVAFPRGGGYFMSMPIAAGDSVLVVFCDYSIDQWRTKGTESAPIDLTPHGVGGPVAIPSVFPVTNPLTSAHASNLALGNDTGVKLYVKTSEIHLGEENASEYIALATKTLNQLTAIKSALDTIVNAFNSHTHLDPMTGPLPPPTVPTTNTYAAQSVAATKVKAT